MPTTEQEEYELPDPAILLSDPSGPIDRMSEEELKAQSEVLSRALLSFGIDGTVTEVRPGPVVTMYEFEPAPGTKVSRIVNLADDLALALKAISLRIVAPLPGKSVVGIEVPNRSRETVSLKEVIMSEAFRRARSRQPDRPAVEEGRGLGRRRRDHERQSGRRILAREHRIGLRAGRDQPLHGDGVLDVVFRQHVVVGEGAGILEDGLVFLRQPGPLGGVYVERLLRAALPPGGPAADRRAEIPAIKSSPE